MLMQDLEPLDPSYVQQILSRPPFVYVSGVINVRDLGGHPSSTHPGKLTKPGFVYRSAEVAGITDEGKEQVRRLGIRKIFDLRSDTEISKYNAPLPVIEGVDLLHIPVFQTEDYSPEMMAKRYQLYASGKTEAFMELYSQILDHGGPAFGSILRFIRDHANEACMFHCTAGKDRTGVMAAILLKLAGVDNAVIANDYSLTRIGREPARAKIMERLSKEPLFASNNEAALIMFTCREETMLAFLELLDTKYGGVVEYIKNYVHLSESDIDIIRNNMFVSSDRVAEEDDTRR
ncbi:protein-tyrosine phosphatase-like protein [Lentinula aff. detonsa]|uniref:Protein-tyrosine phosphatase-like protein n=1 Tax=Lentinula aff. detonsa TaxID=2804958 RepID=A0AA38NI19_9AGAR|nr:protein-tyrosine phosphatase-like protein [Lentinula aff. detonsa]